MKQFTFYFLLAALVIACNDSSISGKKETPKISEAGLKERWKAVHTMSDSIREGDLILRCGNDFVSESLRDFSQNEKLYSHSGIAFRYLGTMYVYSNMAGEINPDEIIRRDPVDSFLNPGNNVAMGVYRYDINQDERNRLKKIFSDHFDHKLQFDMKFDLATDEKMYCAELIAKSVEQATNNRIKFDKSILNKELKQKYLKLLLIHNVVPDPEVAEQRNYIALDNLYINPHCKLVLKYKFGEPQKTFQFPTPENYSH